MYYPGANKPATREEWEQRTLSPIPEVRREALKHIRQDGFTNGLLLAIGIAVVVFLVLNW